MCPESLTTAATVAKLITRTGGCGLFVDYGDHNHILRYIRHFLPYYQPKLLFISFLLRSSLRGFLKHKVVDDIFLNPGEMDLTADVDFLELAKVCNVSADAFGPVLQGQFLQAMGIDVRLKVSDAHNIDVLIIKFFILLLPLSNC